MNILSEMTKQNLHAGTIGWGVILEGIQHCNKNEQNEDYHLSDHGNDKEVMRQNSNAFWLQKMGLDTSVLMNYNQIYRNARAYILLLMAKIIKKIKVVGTI